MALGDEGAADHDVTLALRAAARARGVRHHDGLSHSKDSVYGQHEPQRMPLSGELRVRWRAWVPAGVLCSEMEASTLFVVARLLGRRAGGLMAAVGRDPVDLKPVCSAAVEGVRRLIALDRDRSRG